MHPDGLREALSAISLSTICSVLSNYGLQSCDDPLEAARSLFSCSAPWAHGALEELTGCPVRVLPPLLRLPYPLLRARALGPDDRVVLARAAACPDPRQAAAFALVRRGMSVRRFVQAGSAGRMRRLLRSWEGRGLIVLSAVGLPPTSGDYALAAQTLRPRLDGRATRWQRARESAR
jgi:hypothetical protein